MARVGTDQSLQLNIGFDWAISIPCNLGHQIYGSDPTTERLERLSSREGRRVFQKTMSYPDARIREALCKLHAKHREINYIHSGHGLE